MQPGPGLVKSQHTHSASSRTVVSCLTIETRDLGGIDHCRTHKDSHLSYRYRLEEVGDWRDGKPACDVEERDELGGALWQAVDNIKIVDEVCPPETRLP
jgi:hypothetical protein